MRKSSVFLDFLLGKRKAESEFRYPDAKVQKRVVAAIKNNPKYGDAISYKVFIERSMGEYPAVRQLVKRMNDRSSREHVKKSSYSEYLTRGDLKHAFKKR